MNICNKIIANKPKRLLLVNSVCGIRSTGRICAEIARKYAYNGWDVRIAYGRLNDITEESGRWALKIGNKCSLYLHVIMTRLFDKHGTGICSRIVTKKFIEKAEEYDPTVVWLHNLHGYFLNYELLFRWIKSRPQMEVKWTLHDCWAFTGHCAYFTAVGCNKWKFGCKGCPSKGDYPRSVLFSRSEKNLKEKVQSFSGIKRMSLITPSKWLAELTRKSFLKQYPVAVVNNKIDINVFKPTKGDFRKRFNVENKIVILGVASTWDERKGFSDFIKLRSLLSNLYAIVIVGLTSRQISKLPTGIIGIGLVNGLKELAEIYTAADWFFNPTREDNYPTVNLEARGCGCKIVTYDTGGSKETVEGYEKSWILSGGDKTVEAFVRIVSTFS